MTAFWYLTRGTGIVALILLTLSLTLGIANVLRMRVPGAPRFVTLGIHRSVSLLAVAFVAVHVLTTVADGYVPISIASAVIPFSSGYRPFWVGLGAIAFDLLLALVITSVLRRRVGYRVWRLVHWAAYGCWPIAFVHALGTGSDVGAGWLTAVLASLAGIAGAAIAGRWSTRRTRAIPRKLPISGFSPPV
jgi:methionine sulfoxide reductase heme-binding subunit